jgi:tripartite-type tricarboxylate transporter receptor subunit TctC
MKGFKQLLITSWVALFAVLPSTQVAAQPASQWPTKSITVIVPYAAGGSADTRMRLLARKLTEKLGQPVVIENKAGAGGVIGTALIAKAPADGYTIGTGNMAPLAVNPSMMAKMPYDPAKDIAPIILIEQAPLVLSVANSLPVKNLNDLIALAKKEPGKLTFGSSGVGGAHHLSGEMFSEIAGLNITHVPYKGGAPAATDLMAGHLSMMFEMGYSALPAIQADKIRPLAVTSKARLAILPDVPTMAESGLPGFEAVSWIGALVPAGTPQPIVDKIHTDLVAVLRMPEIKERLGALGAEVVGNTPEQFAAWNRSEIAKWAKAIKESGARAE